MASEIKVRLRKAEISRKEGHEVPVLDLSDAAVKKLIRTAEKRGYIAHNQINALLASEEINSEQIENILANLGEMGINVVETKEPRPEEEIMAREEPDEEEETEGESELTEVQRHAVPAKSGVKELAERTDDPVRIYLREMASMELLSRAGEIAIAKRIEAGREAMIASLCESPLTFQAIIVWRDELNDGKALLRDIIDLEATSPDAKALPTLEIDATGEMNASIAVPDEPGRPQRQALDAIPATTMPLKPASENTGGKEAAHGTINDGYRDDDDDDNENWLSVAAVEAELKPKVIETFDTIAGAYKRLRRLQDQDIQFRLNRQSLSPA